MRARERRSPGPCEIAVARRRPEPGLVHHSDQGSQYVSLALGQCCRRAGIELSMGARGWAYDNAVSEAFFKTLKSELVDRRSWPTKAEARRAVFDFIETFYNRRRRHSTLGYLSPADLTMTCPWRRGNSTTSITGMV